MPKKTVGPKEAKRKAQEKELRARRLKQRPMPKPMRGGKPKQIKTKNAPGGPHTPGAKKKRKAK